MVDENEFIELQRQVMELKENLDEYKSNNMELQTQVLGLKGLLDGYTSPKSDKLSIVVTSRKYEEVLPAYFLANGAVALDWEVDIFHTFWGIKVLQKPGHTPRGENIMQRMMHYMVPGGPKGAPLSNLHMFGAGKFMIKKLMQENGISSLEDQIIQAAQGGVNLLVCNTARELFGMQDYDFIDAVQRCDVGVLEYLTQAQEAGVSLFM